MTQVRAIESANTATAGEAAPLPGGVRDSVTPPQVIDLLYEAGRLLGQTLDLRRVYDAFGEMVRRAMDCAGLIVSEFSADTEQIRCVYAWIEGESQEVSHFPVLQLEPEGGGGLQSGVIRSGQPILVNDFRAHLRAHRAIFYTERDGSYRSALEDEEEPTEPTTRSVLMVPMLLDGRVLGVVQVQSHRKDAFTVEQMRLLEAMTLQVAAASRNAYLFHQVQQAAVQQRRFLCEMLAGFTEGRLRLCFSRDELPAALPRACDPVALTPASLRTVRRQIEGVSEELGTPPERLHDFQTAAHEAAMNAVRHAGGGVAHLHADRAAGMEQLWVEDSGPGIAEDLIHRAVEQGFTTGGFGQGFWLMQSCCDRLFLLTSSAGTTVVLEQARVPPEPPWAR